MSSQALNTPASARALTDKAAHRVRNGMIAGVLISILISAVVWFLSVAIPSKTGSPFEPIRELCRRIAETETGRGILESALSFPIIEGFPLLGIAFSVGVLCWLDLRLLGWVFTNQPVSKVWKQVMLMGVMMRGRSLPQLAREFEPFTLCSLAIILLTGVMLFVAEAVKSFYSNPFRIKIALLVTALVFHYAVSWRLMHKEDAQRSGIFSKVAAGLAIVLWMSVGFAGRAIGFF